MKKRLIALIGGMWAARNVLVLLALSFMLAGCVRVHRRRPHGKVITPVPPPVVVVAPPRPRVVVVAPALPRVVVLGAEPYYVHGGFHYHYRGNRWYYSQSRTGPWVALPRDRYPRQLRYHRDHPGRHGKPPKKHKGKPPRRWGWRR
ncbi:MAG: hypothetical protein HN380_31890 [Victivallales bacterium]|jgi:hypothetical protein|nr:hypothetical protein [Victivallales bacterium]